MLRGRSEWAQDERARRRALVATRKDAATLKTMTSFTWAAGAGEAARAAGAAGEALMGAAAHINIGCK